LDDRFVDRLVASILDLLSEHKVKIITFPPHSSGVFQMLDLVFFGVFKNCKGRLSKAGSVRVMEDHAMTMFRPYETVGASTTVMKLFARAGFIDNKHPDAGYVLGFDERKLRDSAEYQEIWEINVPLEQLSA
jgi:hypothetical protein